MPQAATLSVKIAADINDFGTKLSKAEKTLVKAADNMSAAGQRLTLGVTLPFVALSGALAKSAADDAASVAKLQRTFGAGAQAMESFIGKLMATVPATDDELRGLTTSTDTLLRSMGLLPSKAMGMTQAVTKLAGDLAAYSHVEIGVAQDALEKALAGKTRGLQQFGIVISEADIKAKAYASGIAKVGSELTQAQTAQAAWLAILDKSKLQQGEAARTAGDAANAIKFLKQDLDGAADSFGAVVLPAAARATHVVSGFARGLAELSPGAKTAVVGLGAVAAATGPVLMVTGSLISNVTTLRSGLATLGGGSALAGLGKMLVPGGIVIAGLSLLTYWLYKSGNAAAAAQKQVDDFKQHVATITNPNVLAGDTRVLQAKYDAVQRQMDAVRAKFAGPKSSTNASVRQSAEYFEEQALKKLEAQRAAIAQQMSIVGQQYGSITAMDTSGATSGASGGIGGLTDKFATLTEHAQRVAESYTLIKDRGDDVTRTTVDAVHVLSQLEDAYAGIADKSSQAAISILKAEEALQKSGALTDWTKLAVAQGGLAAGAMTLGPQLTGSNVVNSVAVRLPEAVVQKQAENTAKALKEVADASTKASSDLMRVGDVIGAGLGNFLSRQALGSSGGAFGSSLGSAVGSALVGKLGGSLGKLAGTAIGGPLLGTVFGAVGGILGGGIDRLFGFHRKKVDASADALDRLAKTTEKVNEAFTNLPAGIKISQYRFDASEPATPPEPQKPPTGDGDGFKPTGTGGDGTSSTGGNGNPTSTGGDTIKPSIIINGNVVLQGVTDVHTLWQKLGEHAELLGARSGTTALSLSLA